MARRDEIVAFADAELEPGAFADALPNGLQVTGADEVSLVVSGVSASLELFRRAREAGAQMLVVHHGLFWRADSRRIGRRERERLRVLFDGDISLVAYHLPLDAHAVLGNNAILCRRLGVEDAQPFADHGGRPIGRIGELVPPLSIEELSERVAELTGRPPLAFADGPADVRRLAVVSGAAAGDLLEAADLGADCFLTGEPRETAMAQAREAHVHFLAAGHYATEVFGVQALGAEIARRFGVEHRFIDVPNPV